MSHHVNAELVANVLKVVAAPGDTVTPGDTLVILESMKMEIPVTTEVSGTILEIGVSEGDVVTEGDLIADIDDA
ncbi:MAG TPA: biotin/lipoyl-binding carrier protein [Nocardioidaceae bacterium]|jgi:biotin carboxyl carrier protein